MVKRILRILSVIVFVLFYCNSLNGEVLGKEYSGNIKLKISDYSGVGRVDWPVTSGIPFPKGVLKNPIHVALFDPSGKQIPLQTTVLSRYWEADSTVRWLLLDFNANVPANSSVYYTLKYGNEIERNKFNSPLSIEKKGNEVVINTGVLKLTVSKYFLTNVELKTGNSWKRITSGQGKMTMDIGAPPDTTLLPAVLGKGRNEGLYSSVPGKTVKVEVEDFGPLRAQVKISGWHIWKDGRKFGPYTLRVNAYAGKSYIKVYHTFVNSDLPERGLINNVGIYLPLNIKGDARITYGTEPISATTSGKEGKYYLLQNNWNRYEAFEGNKSEQFNGQCEGWLDVSNNGTGVTSVFRDCAQLFPNEIKFQNNELSIWPYPEDGVGPLDLRREEEKNLPAFQKYKKDQSFLYGLYLSPVKGVKSRHKFAYDFLKELHKGNMQYLSDHTALGFSRTHEINLYFHSSKVTNNQINEFAKASNQPLRAFAENHWYDYTDALGHFGWKDTVDFPKAENYFEKKINWTYRHQNEWFPDRFWGIVNYGDMQSYWEKDLFSGTVVPGQWLWYLGGGWNNYEVDAPKQIFLYYLRSDYNKAWELGEAAVRQMMDVVTAHANLPDFEPVQTVPEWKIGGMNRHEYDPWGGGVLENHTWNEGLIDYYYLTGYRRAYDVAMQVAGFALRLNGNGNRINQWQMYEHQFDRNASDNYRILLKTYELTGIKKYKVAAVEWRNYFLKNSPYSYKGLHQNTFMTVRYLVPTYELDYRLFGNKRVGVEIMNISKWLADMSKKGSSDYFVVHGMLAPALSYDITRGGGPLEDLIKVWWKHMKNFERNSPYCTTKGDFTSMDFNEFEALFRYLRACRDMNLTEKTASISKK